MGKTVQLQTPEEDGRVLIRQALTYNPDKITEELTALGIEVTPAGVNENTLHNAIKVFREPVAEALADIILEHSPATGGRDKGALVSTMLGSVLGAGAAIATAIGQNKAAAAAGAMPGADIYTRPLDSASPPPANTTPWKWIGIAAAALVVVALAFFLMKNKGAAATKLK